MRWFRRAFVLRTEEEQLLDEIGDQLLYLRDLHDRAEAKGLQFRPAARLARTALQSINWLR
jgi:hypothetical protein